MLENVHLLANAATDTPLDPLTLAANAAYVVAALLFVLSLAGLSKHETSRAGISFGIGGMLIAISVTFPLFLIARERKLAASGASNLKADDAG